MIERTYCDIIHSHTIYRLYALFMKGSARSNLSDNKDRKIYWILFTLITLLFLATRLFRLDQVPFTPYGMHFDEMSAAYDAWCIQGWGVDRHLTRFPVYFMNTGPGQNALIFTSLPRLFSSSYIAPVMLTT